jgi:hypothetical protein
MRVQLGLQYQGIVTPVALNVISSYDYGSGVRSTNLTVAAGSAWSGWFEITNPLAVDVAAGSTVPHTYDDVLPLTGIVSIDDPIGIYSGGAGQDDATKIVQDPSPPTILWDNADSPGVNTTPLAGFTQGAVSVDTIPFTWTPIAPDLASAGVDADFDTYRIYYRVAGSSVWSMIDKTLYPGPAPGGLDVIGTGSFNIVNLQALTSYDYFLSAIDIFGNETVLGVVENATTLPSSSTETISDGITTYENSSFTMIPADRPLLDSSIKIEVNIIGASQPDELNLIVASNAAPNLVAAGTLALALNTDYALYNPLTEYFRIPALKTSPNKWVGYISSENPLIAPGQDCKFILEAVKSGVPVYYDYSNDINPNDDVWTFTIINPPKVTPWPTRVLNNVITDKDPIAYPAYYLTDDALVTITAYDIKGRIVAILLDNAPRKSGINIRENGWRGTNKSGRKLGIGLYYLHIKAKRQSDGKTIIDKFNKVVMAR